jgi:hypothetical protein
MFTVKDWTAFREQSLIQSGPIIPWATVTATVATDFGRSVTTGPDRCYMIPNLRPAGYVLTVQVQGFHHFSQTGITLQSDESAVLNVKLEVRAATESIIVQASAVHVDFSLLSLEPNASRRY